MILTELAPLAGEFCLPSAVPGTSLAHPASTPCRTAHTAPWWCRSPRDAAYPAPSWDPLSASPAPLPVSAKIVKAETHLLAFLDDPRFHRRRPEVLLHHDGCGQRPLALEPDAREHEVGILALGRFVSPSQKKSGKKRVHRNRSLRCLRLRHLESPPHIRPPHVHHQVPEVQIRPSQG